MRYTLIGFLLLLSCTSLQKRVEVDPYYCIVACMDAYLYTYVNDINKCELQVITEFRNVCLEYNKMYKNCYLDKDSLEYYWSK